MLSPTKRQLDALRFIVGYQEAHGYAPGFRAIANAINGHVSSAHRLVQGLIERGLLHPVHDPFYSYRAVRLYDVPNPLSIPRGPSGEPLFYVGVKHAND